MKIKGLTLEQIKECATDAGHFRLDNVRQIGNYTFFVLRMASGTPSQCGASTKMTIGGMLPGVGCTRPLGHDGPHWYRHAPHSKIDLEWSSESTPNLRMKYRRKGISNAMWGRGPRYGTAVCFHGFEAFMRECFKINENAQIRTAKAAYLGLEDFERKYPAVGEANVGSQTCFVAYSECCDC